MSINKHIWARCTNESKPKQEPFLVKILKKIVQNFIKKKKTIIIIIAIISFLSIHWQRVKCEFM